MPTQLVRSPAPCSPCGTYVKPKVAAGRVPCVLGRKGSVLTLLPSDRFGLWAYRSGTEYLAAAGLWENNGQDIVLTGLADYRSDYLDDSYDSRPFHRVVTLDQDALPLALIDRELPRWSTQIWEGPHFFLGFDRFVDFSDHALHFWPEEWRDLHEWVDRFLHVRMQPQ